MTQLLLRGLALIVICAPYIAQSQELTELDFQSAHDHFKLQKVSGHFIYLNKAVRLGPFEDFLTLFTSPIEGECEGLGKPDLTVTAKLGGQAVIRQFFVKERMVSDTKACASVTGDGLFFIPLHRSWYSDKPVDTIAVGSPLKLDKAGETLVQLELINGQWRNSLPGQFVNWEFLDKFLLSLKSFPVTHHAHAALVADKPHFTLSLGKATFNFYKVSQTLWMCKRGSSPWLVGSNNWSNWLDMEKAQWLDRWASQLGFVGDKGKDLASRIGTLQSLDGQWSPSIQEAYQHLLLDRTEANDLKLAVIKQVKQKPTFENMGIFIKALTQTTNSEVLNSLTQALRIRYPKGPVVREEDEAADIKKKLDQWQAWWKEAQNSKDKF